MSRLPRLIPALLVATLLASCSNLIGGPKESPKLFAPVLHSQPNPQWPNVTWSLATSRSTNMQMLEGPGIVVSPTAGELQVYRGALWARSPGEMVEDSVLRTLEDSGKIRAVARQGSGMVADYRLMLDIREFRADYAGNPTPSATLDINAKLMHMRDQTLVGSQNFHVVQTANATDINHVVTAFGQALDKLAPDISGWVLTTGQAHELAAHKPDARR